MDINRLVDIKIARFPRISAFDVLLFLNIQIHQHILKIQIIYYIFGLMIHKYYLSY